jgi:hypothetical protein
LLTPGASLFFRSRSAIVFSCRVRLHSEFYVFVAPSFMPNQRF